MMINLPVEQHDADLRKAYNLGFQDGYNEGYDAGYAEGLGDSNEDG